MSGRMILLAATLSVTGFALGACQEVEEATPDEVILPSLPHAERLDPAVHQQIRERHDLVMRLQDEGRSNDDGLAWAFGQLGKIYHAYLETDRARTCYTNARQLDPAEFRWPYYLGYLERLEGHLDVSNAHFLDALAMRPDDVPTLVWLGENQLDLQQLEAARDRFTAAIEIDSRSIKARAGLARATLELGELESAVELFEEALAAQPEATSLHYALGLAYDALGQRELAQESLARVPVESDNHIPVAFDDPLIQEVNDLRDSTQHHARTGMKAISRGHFRIAVNALRQAVEGNPDRPDTRYNLAASLLRLGDRQAARAQLDELIEKTPDYVQARVLLARMLIAEEDLEAAENHLRRAIAIDPQAERVHLALGDALRLAGRLDDARATYARALELAPETALSRFGIAATQMLRGQYQEAAELLEEGLTALPESRELQLLSARLLAAAPKAELRDGARAAELARSAIRGPATVSDAETLAMAMAEIGRFDDAIEWQRAAAERSARAVAAERLARYERGVPCREPWAAGERLTTRRLRPQGGP